MIIVNKASFFRGLFLLVSFVVLFAIILSPVFPGAKGEKVSGLDFADNLFNRLSKGSSWFIPDVTERVKSMNGKEVTVAVTLKKAASAEAVSKMFTAIGATSSAEGAALRVKGDLGKILGAIVADCDAIYHDKPEPVSAKYGGMDGYAALKLWWEGLQPMIKELQKDKLLNEARMVDLVIRKGIEPAYNFQGIEIGSVSKEATLMAALLCFYVVYTLWYGFAFFELSTGVGMTMTKAKKA